MFDSCESSRDDNGTNIAYTVQILRVPELCVCRAGTLDYSGTNHLIIRIKCCGCGALILKYRTVSGPKHRKRR